jgi:hypothetical protein
MYLFGEFSPVGSARSSRATREPDQCSGIEPLVADRVEQVMPSERIEPGPRECHDALKGRLRVDFVYSEAQPRSIALEVTGIWDGWHLGGVTAADRPTPLIIAA